VTGDGCEILTLLDAERGELSHVRRTVSGSSARS
jgi:hypothetical protein